jgi:3-(3-hydroxy-phenyl)propionate hydroxylase
MADTRRNAILIAGAGPVGLAAALALLRRGVAVTVLEAEPALDTAPRGSTFHPRRSRCSWNWAWAAG